MQRWKPKKKQKRKNDPDGELLGLRYAAFGWEPDVNDLEYIFDPNIQSLEHLVINGDGQSNMRHRISSHIQIELKAIGIDLKKNDSGRNWKTCMIA